MFINDLFENMAEYYTDENQDNSVQKLSDVRKTRLTLAQIKRLRMMNDVKKFEEQNKIQALSKQYRPAAAGAAPSL